MPEDWVRQAILYTAQKRSTSEMSDSIQELETQIGMPSGTYDGWKTPYVEVNDLNRHLLRKWLMLHGIGERETQKASDLVLRNAYHGGMPYIRKMKEDSNKTMRRSRYNGFHEAANIDGLLDQSIKEDTTKAITNGVDLATLNNLISGLIEQRVTDRRVAKAVIESLGPALGETFGKQVDRAKEAILESVMRHAESVFKDTHKIIIEEVSKIASKAVPRPIEIVEKGSVIRTLPYEPRHKAFDEILEWLLDGFHCYLVGDAGTGKTHMFKQLAQAMGRPCTILGQTLTKYEFSGHKGPTGEYVGTLLRTAVEEGHFLGIDEVDMSSAAAIGFLNSLTANKYIAFPDRMVEAHPDFRLVAAANTTGFGASKKFIGRNPLDAASLDRLVYVEVTYDEDLERMIFGTDPWVSYCQKARHALTEQLKSDHIVSMRAIERCLAAKKRGKTSEQIAKQGIWRTLQQDTINKVINLIGKPPEENANEAASLDTVFDSLGMLAQRR